MAFVVAAGDLWSRLLHCLMVDDRWSVVLRWPEVSRLHLREFAYGLWF